MNHNYNYLCVYYYFTLENPSEYKNALTQHWSLHCSQNSLAILVVKTQITCNLKSIGKINQCFMIILECL